MSETTRSSLHAWRMGLFALAAATAWVQFGMERYRITGPPLLNTSILPFERWRSSGAGSGKVSFDGAMAHLATETCTEDACHATMETAIPAPNSPYVVVTGTTASAENQGSTRILIVPYKGGVAEWNVLHELFDSIEGFDLTERQRGFRVEPEAELYSVAAQINGPNTQLDVFDVRVEPAEAVASWLYLSRTLALGWCAVTAFFVWKLLGSTRRLPWPVVGGTAVLLLGLMLPMGQRPHWQEDAAHLGLFAALSFAVRRSRPALGNALLALDLVLFSAITELLQSFTPTRAASVGDLAWDALGVGIGLSLATLWPRRAGSPAAA